MTDGIPWLPEDFTGGASRQQRKAEQIMAQAAVASKRLRMTQMGKKGMDLDYLAKHAPWAFGRKGDPRNAGNR